MKEAGGRLGEAVKLISDAPDESRAIIPYVPNSPVSTVEQKLGRVNLKRSPLPINSPPSTKRKKTSQENSTHKLLVVEGSKAPPKKRNVRRLKHQLCRKLAFPLDSISAMEFSNPNCEADGVNFVFTSQISSDGKGGQLGAMKLISWNCQGIGVALTVKNLEVCRRKKPRVAFLMETKQKGKVVRKLRRCGLDEDWIANPEGLSGGLALWWANTVDVEILFSSKNIIHTAVHSSAIPVPKFITFVYGPPKEQDRRKIWSQIVDISKYVSGEWLCVSDYNDFTCQTEKWGGKPRAMRKILNFQKFISDCCPLDLGFNGSQFTWCKKRIHRAHIKERIDRALANVELREGFPRAQVFHMEPVGSDHHILFVDLCHTNVKAPHGFKFKICWFEHPQYKEVMNEA